MVTRGWVVVVGGIVVEVVGATVVVVDVLVVGMTCRSSVALWIGGAEQLARMRARIASPTTRKGQLRRLLVDFTISRTTPTTITTGSSRITMSGPKISAITLIASVLAGRSLGLPATE